MTLRLAERELNLLDLSLELIDLGESGFQVVFRAAALNFGHNLRLVDGSFILRHLVVPDLPEAHVDFFGA